MALIKIQRELVKIAERCDRRGKHEIAEKIRETIDDLRWSSYNSKIAVSIELALESTSNATFENILRKVATSTGYTFGELKKFPHIREYFDYAKRVAKRRAARERDLQRRLMMR